MSVNDTPDVNLDRLLTDWLEADAAPRAPGSLETAFVEGVASTRQRPAWATTERWISMETRAQLGVMPRVVIALLTIALLVAALAASLALAGHLSRADDGSVLAGLTYASRDGVIYQHPTDGTGEPVRLTGTDEVASTFAWSTDGRRFSYESTPDRGGPTTIMIRDADGSSPIAVSETFAVVTGDSVVPRYHAWSPDGSRVIYWAEEHGGTGRCTMQDSFCGQRIWSAPTDGSEPARVIGDPALGARAPVWTPDGSSIVFAGSTGYGFGNDYGIYRMDADGTNVERIGGMFGYAFSLDRLAMSPDGKTVAVGNGDIHLLDLATGEDVLIAGEDANEYAPQWSPDGSLLAFTKRAWSQPADPQAMLYDVASGEIIPLDVPLSVLGWSPDGRSILAGRTEGTLTMVDVTEPMAPVATPIEGVTDAAGASWRPLP